MLQDLELVLDAKATLGEGPCWDSKNQVLYWVNILGKKVNIFNPVKSENREILLDQMVGAIAPRTSGGAIVALEKGFYALNLETEELTPIVDPESHLPENRFNDGKCDPNGRFWAGTMSLNEKRGAGTLYCLDTDMNVNQKWSNVSISNGIAWSPNHKYMYYIDTPTKTVMRFDYDLQSGHIEHPEVVIRIPEGEGSPDGMTIDAEGMLWIAHWGGARISRWNPDTGERLTVIPVPALNVTSCTFGGPELNELYITTARNNLNEQELLKYPLTGGVFKLKTSIEGSPTYSFDG